MLAAKRILAFFSKFFLAVGIISAVAFGIFRFNQKGKSEQWIQVRRGTAIEAVYGIGTVTASRSFQAKAGITSGILALPVQEGQIVKKSDLLVLLSEGGSFRAPFAGTVTKVFYKPGESVFTGNILLSIVDLTNLYLTVNLDQKAAIHVLRNQIAKINFEGLREKTIEGKVRSIYPSESQFIVHIEVKGLPTEVLPGMTADVAIQTGKKERVLMVPAATHSRGKLLRLRSGIQSEIAVKVGLVDDESIEIIEGDLNENDQVAIRKK
jgi:membrane fusion protein, macrolide-specific efflux system